MKPGQYGGYGAFGVFFWLALKVCIQRADIAAILREIADSIDDEERTAKLVGLLTPT